MPARLPTAVLPSLTVEIWSDVVCPWCFIGKRRFEKAVEQVRNEVDVHVVFRPFQLDPTSSGEPTPVVEAYARKFGGPQQAAKIIDNLTSTAASEGIEFHMDRALRANTFAAHRLLWLAESTGHQVALKERLLEAYFVDGLNIADLDVLADCGADVGLDRDRILAFLNSAEGNAEVGAELDHGREMGVTAVPTFVFNGTWQVPGAQEPDTFAQVLRKLAAKQVAAQTADASDDV
ncbi:MAG: DsbA family oxidoreductase [Ilumatobacteraceae bacterium]